MKPILMRHVEAAREESFKVWKNSRPYLHNPWHYHPELEITFIIKGKGILFIGDKILRYKQNDLILVGPNLPHEWRSDCGNTSDHNPECIAVHFKKDFPGEDFYTIPEAIPIKKLLDKSAMGIKIARESTKKVVAKKLLLLLQSKGMERIHLLFSVLNDIACCPELELLSSPIFVRSVNEGQDHKMNVVYKYVIKNFKKQVALEQVARQVNMTTTSFCRFFKKRTNKSFIQYINEIRVGYACKLLVEENHTIRLVAYESGFENISNFNTQFKKIKQLTPRQFIRLHMKKGTAGVFTGIESSVQG